MLTGNREKSLRHVLPISASEAQPTAALRTEVEMESWFPSSCQLNKDLFHTNIWFPEYAKMWLMLDANALDVAIIDLGSSLG